MSHSVAPRMIVALRMDNGRNIFDVLEVDDDTQAKYIIDSLEAEYGTKCKLILKTSDNSIYVYEPDDFIVDPIDEELEKGNLPLLSIYMTPKLSRPRSR